MWQAGGLSSRITVVAAVNTRDREPFVEIG
jgi:hypothetical protein